MLSHFRARKNISEFLLPDNARLVTTDFTHLAIYELHIKFL